MDTTLHFSVEAPVQALRENFRARLAALLSTSTPLCLPDGVGWPSLQAHVQPRRLQRTVPAGYRMVAVQLHWPTTVPAGFAMPASMADVFARALPEGWHVTADHEAVVGADGNTPPRDDAELRIHFITPWVLPRSARTAYGDPELFLQWLAQRWSGRQGTAAPWPDTGKTLRLIHHPASGPGAARASSRQDHVFELAGTLFLRHPSPDLVRALRHLQPANLGGAGGQTRVEWRGHFELGWQMRPCLDRVVTSARRLAVAARTALDHHDVEPPPSVGGVRATSDEVAGGISRALLTGTFAPQPSQAFALHRSGHAPRIVERLSTPDLILQQHLLRVLAPVIEPVLHESAYGCRAGRGREAALAVVTAALREGHVHCARADVSRCFDSISHARLIQRLDELLLQADRVTRHVLRSFIALPYAEGDEIRQRSIGLAQGAPLSPLLAHLFLTPLDHALQDPRWRCVRFMDDVLVLTRTRADAEHALRMLHDAAAALGLELSPAKTGIGQLREGISFLGESLTLASLEARGPSTQAQRKTLLISEDYVQLGVNGEAVEARRAGVVAGTWPLRRIGGLIVLARCNLSSVLLERCSTHGIPIAVALRSGKQISVLTPNQRHAHAAQYRHARWHESLGPVGRLALAQMVEQAKLHNAAALVKQREPRSALLEAIAESRRATDRAGSTDVLRGHEGTVARRMFHWLQQQLLPAFREEFGSRRRARGGPDRLNASLNLGYYLLYTRINAMLRLRGLNPYLGWLHDTEDDYETLVYDLMEPFRPFVDRMLIRQINRQALQARHFARVDGQWRLERPALRAYAQEFERTLGEEVGGHRLRNWLWWQAKAVDDLVQGRAPAWFFRWDLRKAKSSGTGHADEPMLVMADEAEPDGDAYEEAGMEHGRPSDSLRLRAAESSP